MLAVILEDDPDGTHAVVIDTTEDGALWITDSYKTAEEAEQATLVGLTAISPAMALHALSVPCVGHGDGGARAVEFSCRTG